MSSTVDSVRVLSVDGGSDATESVSTVLDRGADGFTIETATGVRDGLDTLAARQIDCVVSAYALSGTDGLSFLEAVREQYTDLPFILYTEAGSETVASRAISAGVTDYIQNEPGIDQSSLLAARIENAVDGGSATGHQRVQAELGLLQQAIDTAAIPLSMTDPSREDNPLVYVNDAFERVTGYTATEALGRNCRFLQGANTDPEKVAQIREAVEREESMTVELINYRADGTEFWNRLTVDPIYDADGELLRYLGSQQDITQRKRHEQQLTRRDRYLRQLYDITADRSRSFTEKVEAVLEIGCEMLDLSYGILSQVQDGEYSFEVVDAPEDWFDAGDVVALEDMYCERTIETEQTQMLTDISGDADTDTRSRPTEWESTCYVGAPVFVDTEVYGTLCFYDAQPRDEEFTEWEITVIELMSRWLSYELDHREETEQLATQNERLEEFVSIISHDLRNPLTVAQSRLELVQRECESEHLQYIENAHERTQTLIDDLLTIARQGDEISDMEPVDLATAVDQCWQTVETGAATLEIEDTETLRADGSRVQQLFENLVRNALDHTDEPPTIRVGLLEPIHMTTRATRDVSPDGFYVADDGPGIPEGERDQLFDSGYTTAAEGTGFGLAIVEQIVDAHDWEITVTHSQSGGARFEITGVDFV